RQRARRARNGRAARLPPARPDLDRRAATAARALEPARQRLRPGRVRPPALAGAQALRGERGRLAPRRVAAPPRAHAAALDGAVRLGAARAPAPRGERALPALRPPGAREARTADLPRAGGRPDGGARRAPVVGDPSGAAAPRRHAPA